MKRCPRLATRAKGKRCPGPVVAEPDQAGRFGVSVGRQRKVKEMPNYCENIVTVKHTDPALLQRAKHALLEERLFEEFIPAIRECPQEWLNDPYLKEWWLEEWCNEHWGTKWDVRIDGWSVGRYECGIIEEGPGFFRCAFLTAWAPPIEAFDALRKLGFEIEAMYLELGNCFSGIYRFGHNYCDSAVPSDMLKVFGYDEDGFEPGDDETGSADAAGAA